MANVVLHLMTRPLALRVATGTYILQMAAGDVCFLGTTRDNMQMFNAISIRYLSLQGPFYYDILTGSPALLQIADDLRVSETHSGALIEPLPPVSGKGGYDQEGT